MKNIRVAGILCIALLTVSCSNRQQKVIPIQTIEEHEKNHAWYYFTDTTFLPVDKPQNVPANIERAWTEAVRISSAATAPHTKTAYAIVNRLGMLELTKDTMELYGENTLFPLNTADSLVFSDGTPVFYLYKSTFFNQDMLSVPHFSSDTDVVSLPELARPFLIEFNPKTKAMFPLVSYANIHLTNEDQVTGIFWNGKTWVCSAKRMTNDGVVFSYFKWEPLVPLTELSPALNKDSVVFYKSSAEEYRSLNTPALFDKAPQEIRTLLASIPKSYSFYLTLKDEDGTSPKSYYHEGTDEKTANAFAATKAACGFTIALFPDGTTYVSYDQNGKEKISAFRLPLLPEGCSYGDFAVAENTLYVAWEERNFYKTGRSGFLSVDLADVLKLTQR